MYENVLLLRSARWYMGLTAKLHERVHLRLMERISHL